MLILEIFLKISIFLKKICVYIHCYKEFVKIYLIQSIDQFCGSATKVWHGSVEQTAKAFARNGATGRSQSRMPVTRNRHTPAMPVCGTAAPAFFYCVALYSILFDTVLHSSMSIPHNRGAAPGMHSV